MSQGLAGLRSCHVARVLGSCLRRLGLVRNRWVQLGAYSAPLHAVQPKTSAVRSAGADEVVDYEKRLHD